MLLNTRPLFTGSVSHQLLPHWLITRVRPPISCTEDEHGVEVRRIRRQRARCAGWHQCLRSHIDLASSLEVSIVHPNHSLQARQKQNSTANADCMCLSNPYPLGSARRTLRAVAAVVELWAELCGDQGSTSPDVCPRTKRPNAHLTAKPCVRLMFHRMRFSHACYTHPAQRRSSLLACT